MKLAVPKKMNLGRDMKKLLKNKMVLYIVLFITVTNVLGYLMVNNIDAVILTFLVGLLTSYFSKNMIVVMISAVIFTNLLVGSKKVSRTPLLEGMKDNNSSEESEDDDKNDHDKEDEEDEEEDDGKDALTNLKPSSLSNSDDNDDIDFPGTLEAAYDNLDKLLSSDAINKMSADTQKLADKQHKLMGNIDKLEPLIMNAEKMMKGLNGGNMQNLLKKYMPN